jgi:hypothetical protein
MTHANSAASVPSIVTTVRAALPRRIVRRALSATAAAALLASSGAALAESYESPAERQLRLASPSDEYYFFADDRKQIVDYKSDRIVRICAGDSRHLVPLKVTHDDDSTMVHRNDCVRVEAKEIYLEPAEMLPTNAMIQAKVRTES